MTGIYKITNKIDGKCYIGQSVNVQARWRKHKVVANQLNGRDCDKPLYRAIRKYGIENFDFKIIEECPKEQLNEREIFWIDYYDSFNLEKGYNLTKGGDNVGEICKKLTEEQVQEIKQKLLDGKTQTSISKDYNVSQTVISYINLGIEYYHEDWDYPIRKRKIQHLCKDCGKPIDKKSIRCISCQAKYRMQLPPIKRDELKKLIREETFSEIGRRFNVVDNTIKSWCKKLNLPYRKKDINTYSDEEWEII